MNILFVRNRGYVPYPEGERDAIETIQRATGVPLNVEYIDVVLPNIYKSFDDTSEVKGLWGLDGVKQMLRDTGQIPEDYYHMVFYFYGSTRFDVAYWTYPNSLNGSAFVEIPTTDGWKFNIKHAICHEFLHACHRLCAFQGILTRDDMDIYDEDWNPMGGANYQRNIRALLPYFAAINVPLRNYKHPTYMRLFMVSLIQKVISISKAKAIMEELKWDTPENVRHSCRVIMDEYKLTWAQKDLLCACIQQESQFNPRAIGHKNPNGTTDYGLCQFNNGKNAQGVPFWIGEGADFKDTDEVLNDPEKNVRIMVREYKRGNLKWWASYTSGEYRKYL